MQREIKLGLQDISSKLQKLNCPLLGDGDEAWIADLLFQPETYRYDLIEWIFCRLKYAIPGPANSPDERIKNIESAVFDLGICREKDVIKGSSPMQKQLVFWKFFVDILYRKSQFADVFKDGVYEEISEDSSTEGSLYEIYESKCNYIHNICESINMRHLFEEKVQLFPPDIEKECRNILATVDLNKLDISTLKDAVKEKFNNHKINKSFVVIPPEELFYKQFQDSSFSSLVEEVNSLEDDISTSLADLKKCAEGDFKDSFNSLRPLMIHNTREEFVDVGPSLKNVEPHLLSLLKFKNSLSILKPAHEKLLSISSDLSTLEKPQEYLSNLDLQSLTSMLQTLTADKEKL